MKRNKGITLIALVITIIVLLILAGVAIAMLSGQNSILAQARNAKTRTEDSQAEESETLGDMEDLMNESTGNLEKIKDYKTNQKIVEGKKAKLQDDNGETIVVPVGFKIKDDSPTEVKKGIVVVAPDNSEFVWVPVKDISKMYGTDSNKKKLGKLYNFSSNGYTALNWKEENGVMSLENADGNREPAYLPDSTYSDGSSFNTAGVTKKSLQNEFDEMIKCVEKNKGFYIGRYETSLNSLENAQSMAKKSSLTGNWYKFYQKEKEYSEKNKLMNVVSSMIWGSQYDQMLIWMQENGLDVTSSTPKEGISVNNTKETGKDGNTDVMNNVNDLIGCLHEWTLEAMNDTNNSVSQEVRVYRGGVWDGVSLPNIRQGSSTTVNGWPFESGSSTSSRITLYMK